MAENKPKRRGGLPRASIQDRVRKYWSKSAAQLKPNGRIRDPDIGLGLSLRLKLIQSIADEAMDPLRAPTEPAFALLCEYDKRRLAEALQPRRLEPVPPIAVRAVAAWLAQTRPEITADALLSELYDGPWAVDQFLEWISGHGRPPRTNTQLFGDKSRTRFLTEGNKDRLAATQDVLDFLRVDDDAAGLNSRLLKVVSGQGMPEGLRAFADHIISMAEQSGIDAGRSICYLPVARDTGSAAAGSNDNVSSDQLIGRLKAFFERAESLSDAPILTGSDDRRAAIALIRRKMARFPVILVLDGWASPTGPVSGLDAAVNDDGLIGLLSEIQEPYLGSDVTRLEPDRFWRNRILIVSESKRLPAALLETGPAIDLEPPNAAAIEVLAKTSRHERRHPVDLIEIAKDNCPDERLRTDSGLTLLDDILHREDPSDTPRSAAYRTELRNARYEDLVHRWIGLVKKEPLATLTLYLLAVTQDGTRTSSLVRILERWDTVTPAASEGVPPHWSLAGIDIANGVEAVLATFTRAWIVVRGDDKPIQGLDDIADSRGDDHRPLDFIALETQLLRSSLANYLIDNEPPQMIARLHRLLAEEALAQYSTIARNNAWSQSFDVKHYRRLIQGLFHGYASLATGPLLPDEGLKRLASRTLPADPAGAYRRLFAVFYRALMERPPSAELARILGREDLKVDLLMMAARTGQDPETLPRALNADERLGFPAEATDREARFLDSKNAADLPILFDQYLGIARACFHADRLDEATIAAEKAERYLRARAGEPTTSNAPWPDSYLHEGVSLSKVLCDIAIFRSKGDMLRTVESHLARAHFDRHWLTRLSAIVGDADARKLDSNLTDLARDIEAAARAGIEAGPHQCDRVAERLASWSDLLCRYGEAIAQETLGGKQSSGRADLLRQAFVYLFAAERIRRNAFSNAPLRRSFYVNGHSTRVIIRVALNLVELIDSRATTKGVPPRDFLVWQARRHLEMLSRYLSRFPTEHASLLILEAAFVRICDKDLALAESILNRADATMAATMHRPRVRLRFLMERISIYLARLSTPKSRVPHTTRRLRRALEIDFRRLEALAAKSNLPMWTRHIKDRRTILDEIGEKLAKRRTTGA